MKIYSIAIRIISKSSIVIGDLYESSSEISISPVAKSLVGLEYPEMKGSLKNEEIFVILQCEKVEGMEKDLLEESKERDYAGFLWQHFWLVISLFVMAFGFRKYLYGVARFLHRQ